MRTDLTTTRTGQAEHAYPPPTRRIMSQHTTDLYESVPVNTGQTTLATPVRYGRLMPDGTIRYLSGKPVSMPTDAENKAAELAESKRRMATIVAGMSADIDHWGRKS